MVANRKLMDGENELVTIERIEPVFVGRNHLHPDSWVAIGDLFGEPLRMAVKTVDRRKFLEAGYIPADIFKNVVTTVHINVITAWEAGQGLTIGEVIPANETAHVHSSQERDAAWKADVGLFGNPVVDGTMATFKRLGETIVWTKDGEGRYMRTTDNVRTLYEAKTPAPHTADALAALLGILAAHGLTPIGKVLPCRDARAIPERDNFAFVLPSTQRIGAARDEFERVWSDGNLYIVTMK